MKFSSSRNHLSIFTSWSICAIVSLLAKSQVKNCESLRLFIWLAKDCKSVVFWMLAIFSSESSLHTHSCTASALSSVKSSSCSTPSAKSRFKSYYKVSKLVYRRLVARYSLFFASSMIQFSLTRNFFNLRSISSEFAITYHYFDSRVAFLFLSSSLSSQISSYMKPARSAF